MQKEDDGKAKGAKKLMLCPPSTQQPNLKNAKLGFPPQFIGFRLFHGGEFQNKKNTVVWVGGSMILEFGVCYGLCNLRYVTDIVRRLMENITKKYRIWYRKFGRNLATGRKVLSCDDDVRDMLKSMDKMDMVTMYVVYEVERDKVHVGPTEQVDCLGGKAHGKGFEPPLVETLSQKPPNIPSTIRPLKLEIRSKATFDLPASSSKPVTLDFSQTQPPTTTVHPKSPHQPQKTQQQHHLPTVILDSPLPRRSPRGHPEIISVQKGPHITKRRELFVDSEVSGEVQGTDEHLVQKNKERKARKKQIAKGKRKLQECRKIDDDPDYEGSESDLSDAPLLEHDFEDIRDDDLFAEGVPDLIGGGSGEGSTKERSVSRGEARLIQELEGGFNFEEEKQYDSDVPGSAHGSDDEIQQNDVFNAEVDLKGPVRLSVGLRFPSVGVLRQAVNKHAVEGGYDFYTIHNGNQRYTAYCINRCGCEWNPKKSRKAACTCGNKVCDWKIYAARMRGEDTIQIRTLRLKHSCHYQNRKVTSKFLALKYLEDWRSDPNWHLVKGFGARITRDLGVRCQYSKLWYARAAAKIMLYGDGADQYKLVWDYVYAVRRAYEGSTAVVSVENIQSLQPTFQRMFVCLKPVMDGFKRGCRPIIGVDGCHLTGAYPWICLVAVGSDGNNNIYPLAWGVVEIEKTDSWIWFLDLLASALGTSSGKGYTFMSDRQKGLLAAFESVVPQAEIRYCWRHIWSNFKLQWNGQMYKDVLWNAAKAATKVEFDKHMAELNFLNQNAHAYIARIEPRHWSRHAFPSTSKSKMLLNNMCESFNNVLRQCRDKPIITHMEWMRRYVMTRHCQKREGASKMKGRFMPYVHKQLEWAVKQVGYCTLSQSSLELFEVEYFGERVIVDVGVGQCSCYNWELTGIPCVHGVAILLYLRRNPEDFIHQFYSKEMYEAAYAPVVVPMPGPKQWEKQPYPEPAPPYFIAMPGRPSNKRRRLEPGEAEEQQGADVGKKNLCGNCRQPGHKRNKCKNPPAPPKEKNKGGRPPSTDPWTVHRREKIAKGKGKGKKGNKQVEVGESSGAPVDLSSQASNITTAGPQASQRSQSQNIRF